MDHMFPELWDDLQDAIANGKYEYAQRLTENFSLCGNLLQHAVYHKDLDLAAWALERGVDVHNLYHNITPLMRACQDGAESLARRILLQDVSQVHRRTESKGMWPGRTPLMFAAGGGSIYIAELLLSFGAVLEARDDRDFTPLMAASQSGHPHMIDFLLGRGASLKVVDSTGSNAFDYAVQSKNVFATASLLRRGAEVNRPTPLGRSIPLWTAIFRNDANMVEFLLLSKADPSWRSSFGENALEYAERAGSPRRIQELLRKYQR
jgi:ankyrin repeat protein